jgi:hypothetical protein
MMRPVCFLFIFDHKTPALCITQIISSCSSSGTSRLLLVVESLVLCLLESVLLATLEHLEVPGFLGERALSQSD